MIITVEQLPNCKATLRVEIPADQVETERNSVISAFAKQVRLPGYRPGKAPKPLVEKKFGKEIKDELTERLMRSGYKEAVDKESLDVLNISDVGEPIFHPDKSFSFSAELTTAPEVELPEYKGIPVQVPKLEITDEQVDQTLENLRKRFAEFEDFEDKDHALAEGDFAVIDYSGTLDGVPLAEAVENVSAYLAGNSGYWVKMDEESFLPGFCAGLYGAKIDEERTVPISLEEEFPVEALKGQDIEYKVTVKGIKQEVLPELDDEFAAKVSEGKTMNQLRGVILEQLEDEAKREIESAKASQILKYLDEELDFELPPEMVQGETQRRVNDIAARATREGGMSEEQLREHEEAIVNSASQQARSNVKASFILEKVAKKEELEVTQGELTKVIASMAVRSGKNPKALMKELQKNNRIPQISENILLDKALEFLKEHAQVEEIEPSDESEEPDEES